ncbi:MAG: hypothetical protein KJI70_00850 [Patescibacteria group bacterium]|nr:hypothetical protein [Patescibacteria group bacterium]
MTQTEKETKIEIVESFLIGEMKTRFKYQGKVFEMIGNKSQQIFVREYTSDEYWNVQKEPETPYEEKLREAFSVYIEKCCPDLPDSARRKLKLLT